MTDRPQIKPGEWIKVAQQECLVIETSEDEESEGQCQVIYDSGSSRRAKATWNGEKWVLVTGGGGYAEKQPQH